MVEMFLTTAPRDQGLEMNMKYNSENVNKLLSEMICSEGSLRVIEVDSISNSDIQNLSIKQINIGCGYSMLMSIEKNSNEIHKYDVMYTAHINSMSRIEKLHAVI